MYQKAAKPQSGALGKLSSEVILRLIKNVYSQFNSILSIGGTETADAVIAHRNGDVILAEVKAAPLLTFPILFDTQKYEPHQVSEHQKVIITTSQLKQCKSALYTHSNFYIPLGLVGDKLWPFKGAVDFICDEHNLPNVEKAISVWRECRDAYKEKDRENPFYYLANASGSPPMVCPGCWVPSNTPDVRWSEADANYCTVCGLKLLDECPACSELVWIQSKFCPECGLNYRNLAKQTNGE